MMAGPMGLLGAILPLAMTMMMGGGQQQPAPAPTPPPAPPPAPEEEPEDAADIEAAKRRAMQRQSDRSQRSLIQLEEEDLSKNLNRKTLLGGPQ